MSLRSSFLERVNALREAGVLSYKDWIDWRKQVNEAVDAFAAARAKLGGAEAQYEGLRPEYITCRLQRHAYLDKFDYVGQSVGKGYGATYTGLCARCGGKAWRWKKPNGMSNGSDFDYPEGYELEGLLERLTVADVQAMEFIADLDTAIRRLEKEHLTGPRGNLTIVDCA